MTNIRLTLALALGLLSGCAAPSAVPHGAIRLAICQRGWHTEIGIPESALSAPLTTLDPATLHRRYLLIGFGARNYFTKPNADAGDAAQALLPGPSAINLAAFDTLSDGSGRKITWLNVSQANINGIQSFVLASLPHDGAAAPAPIVVLNRASVFYAAQPDYNAMYNCNNWAVAALNAGGLPFTNTGLHFASDVQAQAKTLAAEQEP
jgi:hypothetical protein